MDTWANAIAQPATWTDLAFLHCVADAFEVSTNIMAVNDLSDVWLLGRLMPCGGAAPKTELAVGMWVNRHLVAIALTPMRAAAETLGGAVPPSDATAGCLVPRERTLGVCTLASPQGHS